jgi:hypothetical protein
MIKSTLLGKVGIHGALCMTLNRMKYSILFTESMFFKQINWLRLTLPIAFRTYWQREEHQWL